MRVRPLIIFVIFLSSWEVKIRTYLCTEPKRQDLDGVADQESRPSAVIEDIVDKDENNLCIPCSRYSGFDEFSGTDCPDDKRSTHTSGGE
jgi:hypothetical protein